MPRERARGQTRAAHLLAQLISIFSVGIFPFATGIFSQLQKLICTVTSGYVVGLPIYWDFFPVVLPKTAACSQDSKRKKSQSY